MVFRGRGGKLNYEFRLRPGAKVSDIRLVYAGAQGVSLGPIGALLIHTPLGILKDARPRSFQRIDGHRVPIDSRYALAGNSYGFAVGHHDRRHPLLIDPGLAYSTYLGGSSIDTGVGIAVDSAAAAYVTGETASTDFPTTAGASDTSYNGGEDAFVTKLNPAGSSLAYSTYLGGSSDEFVRGIAVDSAGAAYVTGETASTDFPTTAGAFDTSFNGFDAFVTKLNPAGSSLTYSTYLGGSSVGIAVDSARAAYVTGFTGPGFPTTAGAFDTTYNGSGDAFVTKLNPAGSNLTYSTYLGGSDVDGDQGLGIAVDSAGAAYVTGPTDSSDFPTTAGAFDTSANGAHDAFVTKLNPAGSNLAYSTYLGGFSFEVANGLAVDSAAAAYVTGGTFSTDFPTTAGTLDYNGNGDAFVTKLALGPVASAPCSITQGGRITADNGDKARFGGSAQSDGAGNLKGQESYQDRGPAQPQSVTSIQILALTCNQQRTQATIFGRARISGFGSDRMFRIDVQDVGEPGVGRDTYRIQLDTGYDSGVHTLEGGNVQIHG
jgi:Beta-propeller repeat